MKQNLRETTTTSTRSHSSIAPRHGASGLTDYVLGLQRAAGNQAVAAWLTSAVAPVQRKAKAKSAVVAKPAKKKKKAPETISVAIDGSLLRSTDATAELIGFTDSAGSSWVTKAKDPGTGTFQSLAGDTVTLSKLHRVDLAKAGADGTTVATFRAQSAFAQLDDAGSGIVVDGKVPLAPTAMPAMMAGDMMAGGRIELPDGQVWVLMTLPGNSLEWVSASHKKTEFDTRKADVESEAENLPDTMQADFAEVLKVVSLVSVLEGSFGATSGKGDNTASLGIFQWGMRKNQSDDAGSLGDFFNTLKNRASASQAKKAKDRTDEDTLFINAWKQCTDAGLDVAIVKGKVQLTLAGKAAKGKDVESTMSGVMAADDLRTYQLKAAMDWIDAMKAGIVMPGVAAFAKRFVKNGYRFNNSSKVTLTGPARTVTLTVPAVHLTVGDACSSEAALATVANVLPNRPNYVPPALWRALSASDVDSQITDLLKAIEAVQPIAAVAPAGKKKAKKSKAPPAITEATVADAKSYAALQGLIWPTVVPDDDTLINAFEAAALEVYKTEGGKSYKTQRARRLATTHVVDW